MELDLKENRVRASEHRYVRQLQQRLHEGGTLDASEQKAVLDMLSEARDFAPYPQLG